MTWVPGLRARRQGAVLLPAVGIMSASAAATARSPLALVPLLMLVASTWALVGMKHAKRILIALILADLALQWDVSLGFRQDAANVGAEPGLNISLTTIALAALLVLWAVNAADPATPNIRPRFRVAVPLLLYAAVTAASAANAPDPELAGFQVFLLLQSVVVFVCLASLINSRSDLEFALLVLMVVLAIEAALILLIAATGLKFDLAGLATWAPTPGSPDLGYSRSGSTIGPPNTTAAFLAMLLPIGVALLWAPVSTMLRTTAAVGVGVAFPALLLTGSRGGWIAVLVAFGVLSFLLIRARVLTPRGLAKLAVGAALLAAPFAGIVGDRFGGAEDQAAEARLPLAEIGLKMVADKPLLGVGVNNVGVSIRRYAGPQFTGEFLYTIHNKYLVTAAESGVLALVLFVWFLWSIIRRAIRCALGHDDFAVVVGAGLAAALVGESVHMMVDIFTSRPQVQLLLTVAALTAALSQMPRRRASA